MKVFRIIVSILLAVLSVAAIGWAVLAGMNAPEGKKITDATPLVQNVATTDEGIEQFGNEISMMIGDDMLTLEEIEAEEAKLKETETVHIPAYEAKLDQKKEAYLTAEATINELGDKNLNAKQKKEREAAEAVIADYKATNDTLQIYKANVDIMKENIAASIEANETAKADGQNAAALATSVSYTIYWCYALLAIILIIAIISACADLFIGFAQNWKKALIKLVAGVVIVVAIYFVAMFFVDSHGWHEGAVLKDAAGYDLGLGTDPATREVFGASDYRIADFSIIIAYIVGGAAILSAVFAVIIGFFKK
ncbi:MAG: hypothetical protein IKW31_01235 [Alistipes sp.]|nr:hypothetical protein [Alistipes sp.]